MVTIEGQESQVVTEFEPETLSEVFWIMISAAGVILRALFFHPVAKYVFLCLALFCLFEHFRPTFFVPAKKLRSKSRSRSHRSDRTGHSSRKQSTSEKH